MKLSIITVNLNNLSGLKQTLNSIFAQTFSDYESIVIDGGSTDGSKEYIQSQQNKIAYWVSEPDGGVYSAMNKGISKANGDYLLFLNSGDYLLGSNMLAKVFRQQFDEDIVICDAKRLNESGQIEDYVQPDKVDAQFFYRYSLCHQAMFYKREIFNSFGRYNETYRIVSDWEFNLKALIFQKCSYKHIKIPLAYFDNSGESSTNQALRKQERDKVLGELFSQPELAILAKNHQFNHSLLGRITRKIKSILHL